MDESSALTFEVVKSSGDTKSLEAIEVEQEAQSNNKKVEFDSTLVYGVIAIGSVFGVIGIGVCIAAITFKVRKKSDKSKIHAASEDKHATGKKFEDKGELAEPMAHKFSMENLNVSRMGTPERVTLSQRHHQRYKS